MGSWEGIMSKGGQEEERGGWVGVVLPQLKLMLFNKIEF
jgi:hypothetical protein